jgi:hypothetical protein
MTRGQGQHAWLRAVYVHGLLVGDELDPSLDVGHLVVGVWVSIWVIAGLDWSFSSDNAQGEGGYAHAWRWTRLMRVIEKLSRWWLVANVDSVELRGRLIVVAVCLGKRYKARCRV